MNIRVYSDMHLEFGATLIPNIDDIDVLVLAGDIDVGTLGFNWIDTHIPSHLPVVYVAGNHEFYNGNLGIYKLLKEKAEERDNVHFLENACVEIDDVMFFGCTLWTDFNLYPGMQELAMHNARCRMSDYQIIYVDPLNFASDDARRFRTITPDDTWYLHRLSVKYLETALAEFPEQDKVVVTHHTPSIKSVNPRYGNDLMNAAYSSDLTEMMVDHKPKLWVHGHTHDAYDYMIDETRVVCNPWGYQGDNYSFQKDLTLEI